MDDKQNTDFQRSRLTYSREHYKYADYHTALLSKISTCDQCDDVYTGAQAHPLIELQLLNQKQILDYNINLVAPAVLKARPFVSTEEFIQAVKASALATNTDPPLAKLWAEFVVTWRTYKTV